jgi:peptidoglycan/xylan/chitin deacetylase (PgdA/CDA1 family)
VAREHERRLPPWDVTLLTVLIAAAGYFAWLERFDRPQGSGAVFSLTDQALAAPEAGHYNFFRDRPPLGSPLTQQTREVRVPILMYHYVGDLPPGADAIRRGLTVSRADFTAQLNWLRAEGYRSVSLEELYLALAYGGPLPEKAVVLTFDDGYIDNFDVALPLLREYGFSGTFFVITNSVGTPGYMSWDQLRAAHRRGIEVQSHTATHPDLSKAEGARLTAELTSSRDRLRQELGETPYFLCYPAGRYDAETVNQARAAGYLMAVTTRPGSTHRSEGRFELTRVRVSGGDPLEKFVDSVRK